MAPAVAPVLVPAPSPFMPTLVPAPAPMDSPSRAPAPGPYMPPLVPVPAPMAPAPADPFAPAPWTYSPMMAPWSSEPWGELSAINALDSFCHCSTVMQYALCWCVYCAGPSFGVPGAMKSSSPSTERLLHDVLATACILSVALRGTAAQGVPVQDTADFEVFTLCVCLSGRQ